MRLWIFVFLFCPLTALGRQQGNQNVGQLQLELCEGITLSRPIKPDLDSVEKRLVCGDPRAVEAWKRVPLNQSEYHLKTFLQSRGYTQVRFERSGEALKVLIDEPTRITKVEVEGAPSSFDVTRRRNLIGAILNPDKLNDLESWVLSKLKDSGYPCATVKSQAQAATGDVIVTVTPGHKETFGAILEEPSLLKEGTLNRYRAFQTGQYFDDRLLALTGRRAVNEGIVQSVTFDPQCKERPLVIRQSAVIGPPRLLTFGFGFNTEEYFMVRSTWTHSRLGAMASPLEVRATASLRHQELGADWKWYVLDFPSRFYLRPSFTVSREKEPKYETVTVDLQFLPSYDWDFPSFAISFGAGPSVEQTQIIEGVGPPLTQLFLIQTQTEVTSHDFEFYRSEPMKGAHFLLKTAHMSKEAVAKTNASQVLLSSQWLANYAGYDPPLVVLGVRFGLNSTLAESKQAVVENLPSQFRYFLGGISNLRGFSRQELPYYGTGVLTSAFAGVEVRSTGWLPQNLQPYVFADAGALGDQPLSLNPELFWSPGLGLRWSSPIGVFRLSAAHGYISNRDPATPEGISHFQAYLAYGEEF